ncbi:MAG TPA: hypothetical protein VEA69_15810 [Tepidisphaeraceae bacterium]|nr:hypothetical protein [Tepidisphaeraceae bacterium]
MNPLIANLIVEDVVKTLKGVRQSGGFSSTLDVKDEPVDQQRITDGATYVSASDPEPVPDRAPLQHDEYDMVVEIEVYATQSGAVTSPSVHDRARTYAADAYKALRRDYTRGGYAWHCEFGQPQPIDVGGAITGRRITLIVSFRTARDDPFSQ